MKNFSFQSRLRIYQTTLGKYDLIDKYKFSNIKFSFLNNVQLLYTTHKLSSEKLNFLLFNEFLAKQYFSNYWNRRKKLQIFKINLRNYFMCLDFFINSCFLHKDLIIKNYDSLNSICIMLPTSFNTNFLINELNRSFRNVTLTLKFSKKSSHISKFLSYYFIP